MSTSKLAKGIASGSVWLSLGKASSLAIAFIGSIIIARLLGPSDYGVVAVAQAFPLAIYGFADLGLLTTIMRYASMNRTRHASTAFMLRITSSLVAATIVLFKAHEIANLLHRPYIANLVRLLSIYVLCIAIIESGQAVLIGRKSYRAAAIIDSLRSTLRVTIAIILIIIGLGVKGAILGFSISALVVSIIAIYLIKPHITRPSISRNILVELFRYSIPLYLPILLGAVLNRVIDIYLIRHVSNADFGNYSIATNLSTIQLLISSSIAASILSNITSIIEDRERISSVVSKLTMYVAAIMIPLSLALIVLSAPLIEVLYGEKYRRAPLYFSILASRGLYNVVGMVVLTTFIQAVGRTDLIFKANVIYASAYVPLAIILIKSHGILGRLLALIIANIFPALYYIHRIREMYGISLPIKRNASILAVFLILSIPVYYVTQSLLGRIMPLLDLVLGFILVLALYLLAYIVILNEQEINEIRNVVIELSPNRFKIIVIKMFKVIDKIAKQYTRRRF